MCKHLFLTGEKGIGKSTLIQTWLSHYHGHVGGFLTRKQSDVVEGKVSVHLLSIGQDMTPTVTNLLFVCGENQEQETIKRFDTLGCQALEFPVSPDLIVMDELGPHEEQAKQFIGYIFSLLDGEIPILGVLQKSKSMFLSKIISHSNVVIEEVTVYNRDRLCYYNIDELLNLPTTINEYEGK